MLVTTVGMRTQWGKLMATLSEGGDDETPLQVKLNGVATIIGKIGLFFAVIIFAVLVQGLFTRKKNQGSYWSWSRDEALEMLEYFAIAVTIVVVATLIGIVGIKDQVRPGVKEYVVIFKSAGIICMLARLVRIFFMLASYLKTSLVI